MEIVTATAACRCGQCGRFVGVCTSLPNVAGKGEPASSMKTIRMFGASAGSRRGATDAYRPTSASFARQCWPRALAGMEGTLASQVCPSGQPFILPWSLCPALPTLERGG